MNIRFYNARIMTMSCGTGITEGELWVEGSRIAYAGQGEKPVFAGRWDREIDVGGSLLMPGFKNAHTHSAMTFLRSFADDLPLKEWLHETIFPMEARLEAGDIYELTKLAVLEYLTGGITSCFDMYLDVDEAARSFRDCGFRAVICGAMNDFSQSVAAQERCYREYNRPGGLISYVVGFHAEYTTSKEKLEQIADLARRLESPVWCHNSETRAEVEECVRRHGMTPTKLLNELGMFRYGGGGYHCVHMSEEDLEIFRDRGLTAVTNPASNLKLASGIAPVRRMCDLGIRVAIGTDGPASNNCLDMFREMFLTAVLAKQREGDAAAVSADRVLAMAVSDGAIAMGLKECDALEPGKLADLILIDLNQPNLQPLNDIPKNLVYAGGKQNVKLTMVNGRILYEDGRFDIGVEPEEVYARANEIIEIKRKGGGA